MEPRLPVLVAFAFASALAQPPERASTFELADVHVRPPSSILAMRSGFSRGRYELRNATMVDLIRTAWNLDAEKVIGGPGWLEQDRFDVIALAPAGSAPQALHTMLQELLKDRFRLMIHSTSKDFPSYAMTVGKKPLLRQAGGAEDSGCKVAQSKAGEPVTAACRNVTVESFAVWISNVRAASGYLFNYSVADRTGLTGAWNFDLTWVPRIAGAKPVAVNESGTLFEAVEKQLGLKLELVDIPAAVVVVDGVNRTPTGNLPEVKEKIPPPPAEFEVADIRLADPAIGSRGPSVRIDHGGRVRVDMTLKQLIQEAWIDLNADVMIGSTKAMEKTVFEITAKMGGPDLDAGNAVFNGSDIDSMRLMLRGLLRDRFRFTSHTEEREVPGFVLTAAHPKLKKAAGSHRPVCKEEPGADRRDPRIANPIASRLVTCWNMTVSDFAAKLRDFASAYIEPFPPVYDATAIQGNYDFTINFSPPGALPKIAQPRDGEPPVLPESNGAISLSEALDRQLGLKLEMRKITGPVLVIDHVDEQPTAN